MALTPVVLNPGAGGSQIQTDNIGGDSYEVVKVAFGSEGSATMVDGANPLPVSATIDTTGLATSANQSTEIAALASIAAEDFATQVTLAALLAKVIAAPSTEAKQDAIITLLTTIAAITQPLTDAQLRSTPVPVSGTITATGGLTDAQLRATPVPVSATDLDIRNLVFATDKADVSGSTGVGVTGTFFQATQPISAAALPLPAGAATLANQQTDALTDTQLRATPVPVSGTVATGGLTDAQLRAAPVPVSATDLDVRDLAFATDKVDASGTVLGAGTNNIGDVDVLSLPSLPAGNNNIGDVDIASIAAGANIIGKVGIDQTTPGTTNLVRASATASFTDATVVILAVTALQSVASSATVGWQSVLVKNHVTKYNDFKIWVKLTTANTAPANDKAMYVWIIPWYTSDNGTTWNPSSIGTVTLPTGTDAAMTIASPHNLRLLGVLNYTTQQMIVQDSFLLSNCFGNRMPDGFSVGVTNFSGAALSTSCIVDYTGINDTLI